MATGFPSNTGDVLSAAMYNGLTAFTINTTQTADYTAVLNDQYQTVTQMNKATALAFKIPTDASVAFAIGTVLTVLNIGAGTCTISAVTSGTTTVASAGAVSASPTLGQFKSAACIKVAANSWIICGAIG
jgi:hypothetical protein